MYILFGLSAEVYSRRSMAHTPAGSQCQLLRLWELSLSEKISAPLFGRRTQHPRLNNQKHILPQWRLHRWVKTIIGECLGIFGKPNSKKPELSYTKGLDDGEKKNKDPKSHATVHSTACLSEHRLEAMLHTSTDIRGRYGLVTGFQLQQNRSRGKSSRQISLSV